MDITSLSKSEIAICYPIVASAASLGDVDKAALDYISRTVSHGAMKFDLRKDDNSVSSPEGFWRQIKLEFRLLACTDDKKYAKLRADIKNLKGKAVTTVVSLASAGIAGALGVLPGMLTPLVALLLHGCLELGLNAWCALKP